MRVLYVGLEDDYDEEPDQAERPKRPLSASHVPFEVREGSKPNPANPANQGDH